MDFYENVAVCNEKVLEAYLEGGSIEEESVREMIQKRELFPCFFGSALKMEGIEELLFALSEYTKMPEYQEKFGATVFKITRDAQGSRLTHLKVTGGVLKARNLLTGHKQNKPEDIWEEKVNQIRIYSGEKYETKDEVEAGTICAVTGLSYTYPGEGLGIQTESELPILEPVLTYELILPEGVQPQAMMPKLTMLEEEEPELHIVWEEEKKEIHAQIMGEIQMEILKSLIAERFGVNVRFGGRSIVYKETITDTVEGVGHFEPLRHYAEVHLLLEPGEPGSGLVFDTDCSEDILSKNWQRLGLTHLEEKGHRGVLIGAPITDMKITLKSGRAHVKHTEGGDFRQSVYRAVRQGLMQAESVLLEPYYEFRLEVPSEMIGRALTDVQRMYGEFAPPETDGDQSVLTGSAPVACMRDYQKEAVSYTRGRGRLTLVFQGYAPCHNTEEILENAGYDPEADNENPTGSIFCSHGAGYYVPWQEVPEHMHISSKLEKYLRKDKDAEEMHEEADGNGRGVLRNGAAGGSPSKSGRSRDFGAEDRELEEIFMRTYGKIERKKPGSGPRTIIAQPQYKEEKPQKKVF